MIAFQSPADEARTLRRSAARAGCVVRALDVCETSQGRRAVGRVVCPDGWGAARMLVAAAVEDARTVGARDLALELRRQAPSDEAFARAIQSFVKRRVRFVREPGEVFTSAAYTLASGGGDCDDHARLVYAIAAAGGLPARMAFLHHGGPTAQPTHAAVQLGPGGLWSWAETTVDAAYGEHPMDAAVRLGLVNDRQDLAREVRIMTESELPPPPAGFDAANPKTDVERDQQALAMLGHLNGRNGDELRADDPLFRAAVADYQRRAGGLAVDGLIGPKTRARLAQELGRRFPGDDFAQRYIGSVSPQASRIAWGRQVFDQAFAAMGIPASAEGKNALMALAWGETRFGDPALGWEDSHNWGAVTFNPGRGEPFASWGFILHGDRDKNGRPVTMKFQRYPSDLEGAKDKIRIALRTPAARAAVQLESGVPEALAAAMFDAGYYTGTSGTREDRIRAYAAMIRGSMATFAKAGGGLLPGSSAGSVAVLLLVGIGVAAAVGWSLAS